MKWNIRTWNIKNGILGIELETGSRVPGIVVCFLIISSIFPLFREYFPGVFYSNNLGIFEL